MNKRKREPNFTQREEKLLLNAVKKHLKIIENKITDAVSNETKSKVWVQISEDFNRNSERCRETKALKEKYENMKKRAKKVFADEKTFNRGTGGGPYKTFEITDIDIQIKEILGKRLGGLRSHFDDDCSDGDDYNENEEVERSNLYVDEYSGGERIAEDQIDEPILTDPIIENCITIEHDYGSQLPSTSFENHIVEAPIPQKEFNYNLQPSTSFKKYNVQEIRTPVSKVLQSDINTPSKTGRCRPPDVLKTKLGDYGSQQPSTSLENHIVEAPIPQKEINYNLQPSTSFKKYNVQEIRTPVSKVLQSDVNTPSKTGRCRPPDVLKTKLGDWAMRKSELVELQKQHLQEEHEKKMKHLQMKQKLELEHMQKEHEVRIEVILKSSCSCKKSV